MTASTRFAFSTQRILDTAPDGVVCLDPEGRVAYANRAAADLLGYASASDLIGHLLCSHMQFLDKASGTDVCWRVDGSSLPVDYSTAPLEIADGVQTGTVVTFRDVSQRHTAERARDEAISVVSHELRTPLTAIRSAVGLVAAETLGPLPQPAQHLLDIALGNTERLMRLVNDLLDLERLEAGHGQLSLQDCDVRELMRQAADSVEVLARDAGVALHVSAGSARLPADPDRLVQVLTNLLANAIKFSAAGGNIWLDAEQEPGAAEVVLRVRDEGRGIPASHLEMIFDRFAQVEIGDARDKRGTGLGLAISRAIVEQHGGQIWAESTVGSGTTLCVALPAHELAREGGLAEAA